MDPEQITRRLAELSDAGKDAFRSGVARALKDVVDKVSDVGMASRTNRIFGNALSRARIKAAFPDQESYNLLRKALVAEQKFTQTYQGAYAGSPTQARQAAAADALTRVGETAGVLIGTISLALMRFWGPESAGRLASRY